MQLVEKLKKKTGKDKREEEGSGGRERGCKNRVGLQKRDKSTSSVSTRLVH